MCAACQQPKPEPRPGDVETVESGEPPRADETGTGPRGLGAPPGPDDRVAIRLYRHPFTFTVRVATDRRSGPLLTELTITADDGGAVDYAAVRAVPVRRLAQTAAQWIQRWGGQIAFVGDTAQTWTRPENSDPNVYRAATIADKALSLGLPVRSTVAAELGVSTRTVDRLLKRAKAQGWFDADSLPKRPQPPQRDTTAATTEET
jgi:hypothetical protein